MKITQLNSPVFRRIFFVILLCALVPIAGLATLTYINARTQLISDTGKRLHHASKNIGLTLIAKLIDLETTLEEVALVQSLPTITKQRQISLPGLPENAFASTLFFPVEGTELQTFFSLTDKDNERIRQGHPQIVLLKKLQGTEIWIINLVADHNKQLATIAARINPDFILRYAEIFVPNNAQFEIVDSRLRPLINNEFIPRITAAMVLSEQASRKRYIEIEENDSGWLVGSWSVFLRAHFNTDSWYVLVCEPEEVVFASLYQFARNAGMTGILAFWLILLASSILVRKILSPLHYLQKATKLVGTGGYKCQVEITSKDEFEELSKSFNLMAAKIHNQLQHQDKMSRTVREMLGEIDQKNIIQKLLNGLEGLVHSEQVGFISYEQNARPNSKIWLTTTVQGFLSEQSLDLPVNPSELEIPEMSGEQYKFMTADAYPQIFQPFAERDARHFILLPVLISAETQGLLIFVYSDNKLFSGEYAVLRQLADQLGIALSKAAIVDELDHLNFGVLTALARSVDANSKWTRGHSERVTSYALTIAKEMGLDDSVLLEINRAALLHDLGKIAVPSEILNKQGKLTAEEYAAMKQHPSEAARIIEPIKVFDKIRPAVEQHHECWDGSGYPFGLKGEEIDPIARILAVADVYDALYSDRPYRESWSQEQVLNHMMRGRGTAFDPKVVDALFKVIHRIEGLPASWAKSLSFSV